MKILTFISRLGYRKVYFKENKIMIDQNGIIGTFDLDKIDDKIKMDDETKKLLITIRELKTQEAREKDIIKDFQKSGWRLLSDGRSNK